LLGTNSLIYPELLCASDEDKEFNGNDIRVALAATWATCTIFSATSRWPSTTTTKDSKSQKNSETRYKFYFCHSLGKESSDLFYTFGRKFEKILAGNLKKFWREIRNFFGGKFQNIFGGKTD
jgi:hypothetical protein